MLDRRTSIKAFMGATIAALSGPVAFSQAKKRIAFANVSNDNPFGAAVLQSVKASAAKHPEFELTYMDNRQDAAQALIEIEQLFKRKFDED